MLDGTTDPATPIDPTTVDIGALLTSGQSLLQGLAPLSAAVTTDQAALASAQSQLQTDQLAQTAAVAQVQAAGHDLINAISAQFFLTTSPTSPPAS